MSSTILKDAQEFVTARNTYSKKGPAVYDGLFLKRMVMDELEELRVAKNPTEKVDAILDIAYYTLTELCKVGGLTDGLDTLAFDDEKDEPYPHDFDYEQVYNFVSLLDFKWPWCANVLVYYCVHLLREIPAATCWRRVHFANMTKYRGNVRIVDGKVMKPDDFVPPDDDLTRILEGSRPLLGPDA
ncbi:MAG: hypothetical protein CMK92_00760 [Pseudomonas sp.]|nr:hypothetical protein [Pseudomonas sp.]